MSGTTQQYPLFEQKHRKMQRLEARKGRIFRIFRDMHQPTRSSVFGVAVFAPRCPAMSCAETQVSNMAKGESRTLALVWRDYGGFGIT